MIERTFSPARRLRARLRAAAMRHVAPGLLFALALALVPHASVAQTPIAPADRGELVEVTDPYLEVRTGPGRGYPITFVVPRGEWIGVLLRQTDWFKVQTERGKQGWVHRTQLRNTLSAAAAHESLRDIVLEAYLRQRVELGAAWGHIKSEPMVKLWTGYRPHETLLIEAAVGQLQSGFAGTEFWQINLNAEPWSDRTWSPFLAIGAGRFRNLPATGSPSAITTSTALANAKFLDGSLGIRYRLGEHYALRADYTIYTIFIGNNRISEFRAATFGMTFLF
jgi:hypothetical protein